MALRISGRALLRDAFQIPALAEGVHRILRETLGCPPFLNYGPHVGRESVLQQRFSADQITFFLRVAKFAVVDERGLGEKLLGHSDSLNHGFNLAFEVMALVDHVTDFGLLAALRFKEKNLVEDAKDLVGINRSEGQIVVGVAAIVKVETAEHALR